MDFQQEFPSFNTQENDPIQRLEYQQTASSAKLEKISHRLTMVSVMIPILILALIAFVYMDMRERVISSDSSKQSQMEEVSSQITEKLNSLDTRLAKNQHEFDQQLPKLMASIHDLSQKADTVSGNAKKISARVASLEKGKTSLNKSMSAMKNSIEKAKKQFSSIDGRIKKNISALENIERSNKDLVESINNAVAETQKKIQIIDGQIHALKKENQESINLVQNYEKQFKELKNNTSRSLEDVRDHIKRVEISVAAIARNLANQAEKPAVPKTRLPKPSPASASPEPPKGKVPTDGTFTGISAQPLTE